MTERELAAKFTKPSLLMMTVRHRLNISLLEYAANVKKNSPDDVVRKGVLTAVDVARSEINFLIDDEGKILKDDIAELALSLGMTYEELEKL